MQVLRTPDEAFRDVPGFSFPPRYTTLPSGEGGDLRG